MASITERKRKDGTVVYSMRIRLVGLPLFTLTFDDMDEACEWALDNEWEFRKDPEKYFEWKERRFWEMKRNGVLHLKRPDPKKDKIFC